MICYHVITIIEPRPISSLCYSETTDVMVFVNIFCYTIWFTYACVDIIVDMVELSWIQILVYLIVFTPFVLFQLSASVNICYYIMNIVKGYFIYECTTYLNEICQRHCREHNLVDTLFVFIMGVGCYLTMIEPKNNIIYIFVGIINAITIYFVNMIYSLKIYHILKQIPKCMTNVHNDIYDKAKRILLIKTDIKIIPVKSRLIVITTDKN